MVRDNDSFGWPATRIIVLPHEEKEAKSEWISFGYVWSHVILLHEYQKARSFLRMGLFLLLHGDALLCLSTRYLLTRFL